MSKILDKIKTIGSALASAFKFVFCGVDWAMAVSLATVFTLMGYFVDGETLSTSAYYGLLAGGCVLILCMVARLWGYASTMGSEEATDKIKYRVVRRVSESSADLIAKIVEKSSEEINDLREVIAEKDKRIEQLDKSLKDALDRYVDASVATVTKNDHKTDAKPAPKKKGRPAKKKVEKKVGK